MNLRDNTAASARKLEPIASPIAPERIKAELDRAEIMLDSTPEKAQKGFIIYRAIGRDIPETLLELGRLREETFRTVGEGTGQARDIDRFDPDYDHFIAWDKKTA